MTAEDRYRVRTALACYRQEPMFDEAFFGKEFAERAQEFNREHGGLGISVEVVTLAGERIDVLEVSSTKEGMMRLATRDERLVFLPYTQIAHVDVSAQRDHRIASFELPTDSA